MRRLLSRLAGAPRVLVLLLALHVTLKVVLFSYLSHAPVHGDERYYFDSARALSNLVRDLAGLGPVDVAELERNVVGNGWFMPGNALVLAPLFVVDPQASIMTVRLYLGVFSTVLLVVTVLRIRQVLGDLYAVVLLAAPGLVPMWVLFSFGGWSDLVAGLLIVLLMADIVVWVRRLRAGLPPSARDTARLGLLAAAVLYWRSSTSLLLLGMGLVVLGATLCVARGRERARTLGSCALAAGVFLALLAPWSLVASHTLGGPVVTTTSVPTSLANAFGDPDELCYGPCDPTSTRWFTPVRYAREVARSTDTDELEVLDRMSVRARAGVTPRSYADDVLDGFELYARRPASFSHDVRSPGQRLGTSYRLVVTGTNVMWAFLVVAGLVLAVTVVRRSVDLAALSLLVTLGICALLTQPFVHVAGTRYWTSAAPLGALAAALLLQLLDARRARPRLGAEPWSRLGHEAGQGAAAGEAALRRFLTLTQAALAVGVVIVAATLWVLAAS